MSTRPPFARALGGCVVAAATAMSAAHAAPVVSNYYLLGVANEVADAGKNDALVTWLRKFNNWRGRQIYNGDDVDKRARPVWLFDNQDGSQVGTLLDQFATTHAIGDADVFIFYYAGHSSRLPDQADAASGKDETDGQDEVLLKAGRPDTLRDDDLAAKVAAIGKADTLRIVILDTCNAQGFATGTRDLGSLANTTVFFSTEDNTRCETTRWLDSITRAGGLADIDKGITVDTWTEDAKNKRVTFEEWAKWSIALAREQSHEVPGYSYANMGESPWRRPVLEIPVAEPPLAALAGIALLALGVVARWR